ncbi:golgin subfamily B member 1-like isoform X5 [Vigna umbellata]|uniref:golgin subfamily B member 1-like isoform X5 n=1 Tax=Vigna umbellata TaxID=87088 RepID=UPI001F5F67A0|nr:golgin subfamily B member 1-like isoform X5 [Vigna umbellata]
MPIDEAQQPIANAVSVRSKALEESSQEIPPKAYVKSNKEVKTPESVSNEVVEISTTNYTEKQEVPKAHVGEGERIGDKFNQEKEEGIESTNIQEEEVRITSSTLVSVKGDTNQIPQQETLHVNESEVIENAIVVQEWEVFETKDNAGTIIENLDEDASEIRGKDGTDAKQFTDLEMSKSETEEEIQDNRKFNQREEEKKIDEVTGMQTPQEEVHTTSPTPAFVKSHTDITQQEKAFHLNESNVILTAKQSCIPEFEHDRNPTVQEIEVFETKHNVNRVMENLDKEETEIRENEKTDTTQLNEESGQQDKQLEADITDQSNKKVQTPEYVTEENVEINITDYAEEKNQNPTDHAKENEGIEDIFKQEEKEKLIEETTNTQSEEEEVQTHAPAFVIGDTNQIPHQETMHADESKVMDNAKQSYIPEIELDGKAIVFQETEVSESLYKKDATEIRVKKEIDAKKLTDSEMPKPEIEEDEALKPIANAELVRTEAVEESGKQETQPKEDITEETADESNKEVLVKKFVITEETAEINTNNCTKEHDTVKTSPAKELEGTGDGAKLHEEEANGIEENIKTQNPEEEFQTSSPTPAFVQGDSGQTLQQETVNIDESEVLDNDKHRSIPEIELDGKSTVVQETNNPEIEDNISTGAEDLDNKDAIEVQAEEGAYVKQLTNVEIPNSEVKGVPKDEALQLKANIVLNVTEAIDEGSQQVIQPQADVTQKSNKDVKTPEYVTAETIEINTTNYTKEQEKVPSIHAEVEGIKNKFNHKEEAKGIEETTKLQSLDEIQTKSPTSIFVQGDKNQVPIQETLPIDASKVIDSAKQSCIPEIKLDENSTVAQETEKPETKNIVNIITKNFDEKDASEIRAEEGSYDKQVTEVERSNSLAEEYEPIAITVAVGTETVDDSNQEKIQFEEDVAEKKSSKEEQTPHYCDEDTTEINTNNYADEHDKDQTSHAKVKEGIANEKNLDQTENAKGIDKTSKMKIPEEEIQTRSTTPTIVQDDTDQISQKELLHVVESGVIDNIKQSCTPEMQFDRKSTIVQETENPETEDNVGIITENIGTNNARKIIAEEATDSKKLADFKMHDPEMKGVQDNEAPQPVAIATAVKTETVDDSNKEQIQLEDIIEKKSNKEEQTLQDVAKDTVKINTNNYTNEHDKVQKSHAEVKEGIGDDENFDQDEETKDIEETRKMQLAEQKVQKRSLTPAFVQGDTDQISQKELLHNVESDIIHYDKHICIPEIEPDRKSTIVQETEKTDTEENISKETKNLGTNYAGEISAKEEIDVKKLVDLKIPKSEIQVVVRAQSVDDSNQEQIQLEDITEKNSNKGEQTTQNVAGDTAEININSYTDEHDKVQTSDAEVRERSEDDENFGQQEECKGIKETCKMQLPEKEVRTRSPTPSFVQGNIDQISQQEPLHVDKSEVIDYMKQSSHTEPEIQLDKKSTMVQFNQGTEKPETKDNVGIATDKLGTSDPSKIRAEKRTDAKKSTDFMMPKPEIKDKEVPEDEVPQPIEVAVAVETVDDINQKEIPIEEDITEKKSNKDEQSSQYVAKDTTEIKTNIYIDEHDKVQTSHAEVNQGTEDDENFGQVEEAKGIEETNKVQLPEEEVQIRSPTPAFVQGDTDQISQQELLLVDESEVIDYVEQSCIPEIELDRKSTIVQETEKPETKNNVSIVTENLGTNDASEIIAKEETDAEKLADVKIVKSEIKGAPKDETLKPIANAVLLRTEAVEKSSQQDKQQEAEVSDKSIKEVQSQEYITEGSVEININNEAEEKDKNSTSNAEKEGTSHAEEKEGIEDIFNQKEKEKEIEEATKTHSVEEEEIQRRSPPPGFVQGDTNQILHQETLHINESEVIHNAKLSYIPEIELHEKAIVVQKSEKVETKDNFDKVRENLNKDESENRAEEGIDVNQLTDLEMPKSETKAGVLEDDSLQPMPDTVSVEKGAVSVSQEKRQPQEEFIKKVNKEVQTPQYFTEDREKIEITNDTEEQEEVSTSQPKEKSGNNDDDKFEQEEKKGIEESTKTQLQDKDISTTIGEPEDKALITRLNSSSNGNEGLDESSPEKFTENLNKDVQTPQCNTKVNAETNITSYPDKLEEAEDIEESIEKQLAEEEIQHTLPTPTSVQEDIDQMSQQQTLHDDEIEVINNAKSCMTEIELDRKSIVVEESKQPETKANADLVKEEQADHQSEESSVQSFITNYIIVERHTTSESNKELSDDVDLDGQKKVESHLEEFLEIKDASEIRAKGIHSKQLTDVEIQKSETEGVAEDKGMQTMSSTSVKNYAFDECCQEEIQPREEYAETHIKEVKMPHYEFNMQKHIPEVDGVEEDTCQIRVVNEQKLESQLASLNKETTFIDNRYSDGEIENINAISDIEKEVNPKSHTKQKLVIHDSIFNEEEAKGIEEMTKIKLLNSATDCSPEEVQPKLPDPATIQGDTDQILQQQTLSSDALDTIDNNLRSFPENELDRMSTSVEEPETKANINIVEEQSDKQSHEPSMQSLITDYITAEGHLASENSSKLSYDKKEQKTVNLQMVENLGIKYASKTTTEEVTDTKQPTGVELEKTKNEELIENKTLDESNQEEMQPEEDFSETYTKGKKTPQSSMENVNSEGMEITENSSKSSYAEEEQEQVINTYTIENSEIKDSRRVKLEEASYIKEATDESVDKAISFLSTIPSVRIGIVDESIQEKIQKDVQPAVINSKAEQRPENDFVRNMEVLEGPGNTSVENDEKVEVQSEANNQKTIKKHPNLEELETAEISPSSDTKELGKEREVAKLGGVSESVSVDITEHIDTGKLETQEAETGISGNTKEVKAGEEFEKISLSSSVGVISRDSQDSGTKVLHKKSHGILSGVGSKVKHSISKVKKVITGKSSHPKTPPS